MSPRSSANRSPEHCPLQRVPYGNRQTGEVVSPYCWCNIVNYPNNRVVDCWCKRVCTNDGVVDAMASRVENRRSGFSLSVAVELAFAVPASIRLGVTLFPVAE
jgi:hypothetical protein